MTSSPKLLVKWEPRWRGFVTSIRPALARSRPRLSIECNVGMRPGGSTLASAMMHISVLVFSLLVFTHGIRSTAYEHVDAYEDLNSADYHIIYYRGQELPQMTDAGGAREGLSGKAGGRELYHPTQTIRIARGNKLVEVVVDAPSIKLPRTNQPVANLLSLPAGTLPAPPAEALRNLGSRRITQDVTAVMPAPLAPRRVPGLQSDTQVAPPRPSIGQQLAGMRLPNADIQVVPAPISAAPREIGYTAKLTLPATTVVAPPVDPMLPIGDHNRAGPRIASVQVLDVVPPAPGVPGSGSGNGGLVGSTINALSSMVGAVTGPAGVSAGNSSGERGPGAGGEGLIVSATPGGSVGVPSNGEPGSIAMSPTGGNQPGLGGTGGGTGIGRGTGTGSGTSGTGTGSGSSGLGLGAGAADPGNSLGTGPGGSGSGQGSSGGLRGVTVQGGHVTLPSFSTATSSPGSPSHGPKEKRNAPAITIIATSRSGGAVNLYGALKGAKVYTIYIETAIGTALLQFAEHSSPVSDFEQDLTAPEVLNYNISADIPRSRILLSCIMDKSGALKQIKILESARSEVTSQVIAAIQRWRFRPVLRGDEPVDVDVILGFNVDTSR